KRIKSRADSQGLGGSNSNFPIAYILPAEDVTLAGLSIRGSCENASHRIGDVDHTSTSGEIQNGFAAGRLQNHLRAPVCLSPGTQKGARIHDHRIQSPADFLKNGFFGVLLGNVVVKARSIQVK